MAWIGASLKGEVMTRDRMKDLLIVGYLPFLIVAYASIDWSFLSPLSGQKRNCDIYHQHAEPSHKCERFDDPRKFIHD